MIPRDEGDLAYDGPYSTIGEAHISIIGFGLGFTKSFKAFTLTFMLGLMSALADKSEPHLLKVLSKEIWYLTPGFVLGYITRLKMDKKYGN